MNKVCTLVASAVVLIAGIPLLSQTSQSAKLTFDVVSIKPSAPAVGFTRGGGARGNRYTMSNATTRMLIQQAYQRNAPGAPVGQIQISGAPSWIDSDRYDIQATIDCSGGTLTRDQVLQMVQAMLEDRFQLKIHMETRELPTYNLVATKDGAKIKASADQTPTGPPTGPQYCGPAPATPTPAPPPLPPPGQRGGPGDPNFVMPRGGIMMMMNPTGITMQGTAVPVANLINMIQQQVGRPVIDKTDLKGLFDFRLQFSPEGLNLPGPPGGLPPVAGPTANPGGITPTTPADTIASLFTALQDLGLKLESSKAPIEVMVIDSVQKPTMN